MDAVVDIACEGRFVISYPVSVRNLNAPTSANEAIALAFESAVEDGLLSQSDRGDCFFKVREPGPIYSVRELKDGTYGVDKVTPPSGHVTTITSFAAEREAESWILDTLGLKPT